MAQYISTPGPPQLPPEGSSEGCTQSPTRGAPVRWLMQCCHSRPQIFRPLHRSSSQPHLRPAQPAFGAAPAVGVCRLHAAPMHALVQCRHSRPQFLRPLHRSLSQPHLRPAQAALGSAPAAGSCCWVHKPGAFIDAVLPQQAAELLTLAIPGPGSPTCGLHRQAGGCSCCGGTLLGV